MDEKAKAQRDWPTCSSVHNSEIVELTFELMSVWEQSLCSDRLPYSAANLNPCSSLIGPEPGS